MFIRSFRHLFGFVFLLLVPYTAWGQQHFTNCITTDVNDATVLVPSTVDLGALDSLKTGDEIALFSNDGQCAGVGVWNAGEDALSIAVAGVDTTAEISNGYEADETLKYRIWREQADQEVNVSTASYTCTLPGCRSNGEYKRDAIYEVTKLSVSSSSLPVELASLEADRQGQSVVLTWRTTSETDNAGFRVQHKTKNTSWSTLTFVEGEGTTTKPQSYQYNVEDLSYGTHTFRLEQVDRGGMTTLSETRSVELALQKDYALSKVNPNPVRQAGRLNLTVKNSQRIVVRLYDVLGRAQAVLLNRRVSSYDKETIRIDTDGLSSGQYFLRIRGDDFSTTRRMTIVR